jgi:hypothetical protein
VFPCSLKNSNTFVGNFLVVLEEVPKFDTFNAIGTPALDKFSLKVGGNEKGGGSGRRQ